MSLFVTDPENYAITPLVPFELRLILAAKAQSIILFSVSLLTATSLPGSLILPTFGARERNTLVGSSHVLSPSILEMTNKLLKGVVA